MKNIILALGLALAASHASATTSGSVWNDPVYFEEKTYNSAWDYCVLNFWSCITGADGMEVEVICNET